MSYFNCEHSVCSNYAERLFTHISTTLYGHVLIYTAEWTGALWRERKCPNFETVVVVKVIRTRAHLFAGLAFYRWATAPRKCFEPSNGQDTTLYKNVLFYLTYIDSFASRYSASPPNSHTWDELELWLVLGFSLEQAKDWVRQLQSGGGCNLLKALEHMYKRKDIDNVCVILGCVWVSRSLSPSLFSISVIYSVKVCFWFHVSCYCCIILLW